MQTPGHGESLIGKLRESISRVVSFSLTFIGVTSGSYKYGGSTRILRRESAIYLPASEGCKDANDMLVAGVDLVSWVTAHLVELNGTNETKSAVIDDALQARIVAFTSRPCASCGGYEYAFLDDGRLICPC